MKKLLLLAAFGLMASPALAQSNSSSISQTGPDNDADVQQDGGHSSVISQSNFALPGHIAQVDQFGGSGSSSDILQEQRGAVAVVAQDGNDNVSGIKQSGPNDAGDAPTQEAGIFQQGDRNVLGSYANYEGRAFQKNGTSFDNDKNFLDLDQVGDDNKAGVWQEHGADATIAQTGAGNEARTYQTSAPVGTVNDIDVTQTGDDNFAHLRQSGGDGNTALVQQIGDLNESTFTQTGASNRAVERMTAGSYNVVTIDQNGSSNRAVYEIWGDSNTMDIDQTGNNHNTAINGRGTPPAPGGGVSDNTIDIDQFGGDGNQIDGYFANGSESDTVTISQDGTGNLMNSGAMSDYGLYVDGDLNTVEVMQTGMGNTSDVTVIGDGNTSTVSQSN